MEDTRFENITVAPAPHISRPVWTYQVMTDVIIGLVPLVAIAIISLVCREVIQFNPCESSALIET